MENSLACSILGRKKDQNFVRHDFRKMLAPALNRAIRAGRLAATLLLISCSDQPDVIASAPDVIAESMSAIPAGPRFPNRHENAQPPAAETRPGTPKIMGIGVPADITAWHRPLYAASRHMSIITAIAENADDSLQQVEIHAIRGKISDCTEIRSQASVIPCRKNAVVLTPKECQVTMGQDPAECSMDVRIDNGDMVTYVAIAVRKSGTPSQTPAITYAGGQPPVTVAMPVWSHTYGNTASNIDRLQLALYTSPTFGGNAANFAANVSSILDNAYFNPEKHFSLVYTANRHLFDLWAFPFEGATPFNGGCAHDFKEKAANLDGLVDGSAIIHTTGLRDCSTIKSDGSGVGSVDASDGKESWLLVHESGHFLFGLADEYGPGGQTAESDPPNVFSDKASCKSLAASYGWQPDCMKFGWITSTYRVRTVKPETMSSARIYTSDFRHMSERAVENRLTRCAAGNCD